MVSVDVKVTTPEQLTKLLLFCNDLGISATPTGALAFAPALFDTTPQTPSKAFQELCGPEWLTPKKQISSKGVYDFLANYIRSHGLRQADGSIALTELLRFVFQTQVHRIYEHDLPGIVTRVFSPQPNVL